MTGEEIEIDLNSDHEDVAVVNNSANEAFDKAINDIMGRITNKQYPHVERLIEITSLMMSEAPPAEASLVNGYGTYLQMHVLRKVRTIIL